MNRAADVVAGGVGLALASPVLAAAAIAIKLDDGGPVFYRVWRGRANGLTCPPTPGARLCKLVLPEVGVAKTGRFVDLAPRGRWVYRVALAANWLDDPQYGDPYLVSRPVSVIVP